MLVRKALSLLMLLSFSQAFAAASICDVNCFLAHTGTTAAHHHAESGLHSRHEHAGTHTVAARTSPCDEMIGVNCSTTCGSKVNVNKNAIVESLRLLPAFNVERATPIVIASQSPDRKVLFPQARSSPLSAILRI